jgi:predicted SprT family Zn-dependent metalloprotease
MHLPLAATLARQLMDEHRLTGWTFRFDSAKRRFGLCNYTTKTISLSRHLTGLNGEAQVRDTLLHEIAHALTPRSGHGRAWREKCLEIGARPERCLDLEGVTQPAPAYLLVCPRCDLKLPRERKTRRAVACKRCCNRYNGGRYSSRYRLLWQHPD